jgi:hypothetical protein
MVVQLAQQQERRDADRVIRRLDRLVTRGPRDLDIAYAMSGYGYDAVKWAEGQSMLAELVSGDWPLERHVATAIRWYNEAAAAARRALDTQPQLLDKLGVTEVVLE